MNASLLALALVALATLNSQLSTAHAQGSLMPPAGMPAPVMKSLAQVEPRTPLEPGQPGVLFTNGSYQIIKTGSYYLTGSITGVIGQAGILLYADNITLDLNGFNLIGVPGLLHGITDSEEMGGAHYKIFNGRIQNWGQRGISLNAADGVIESVKVSSCAVSGIVSYGSNARVIQCSVIGSTIEGIHCGGSAEISDCQVQYMNTGGSAYGITIDSGRVRQCSVSNIGGGIAARGINIEYSGFVENCSVDMVTSQTGNVVGISASIVRNCHINQVLSGSGSSSGINGNAADGLITGCVINNIEGGTCQGINIASFRYVVQSSKISSIKGSGGNAAGISSTVSATSSSLIQNCDVSSVTNTGAAGGWGIVVHRGQVQDCNISGTKNHGIYANGRASVINCRVNGSGVSGTDAGIFVSSFMNRVEGNYVCDSKVGIEINGNSEGVLLRNVCVGNATNYLISGGGIAVILTSVGAAAATNPLANISY